MGRDKKRSNRHRSPSSSSSTSSEKDYNIRGKHKRQKKSYIVQPAETIAVSTVIPDFDPKFKDIKDWIEIIQYNANIYHWSDTGTIFQALSKLKGTAKMWYDSFIESELGWSQFTWEE